MAGTVILDQTALVWVVAAAALVLVMQGGFAAFEAGLTRPKNAASVALAKLTGTLVAAAALWVCGFALLFGASAGGLFGRSGFFLGGLDTQSSRLAFFCLQVVFAATTASVVSGALAERMRFKAALVLTAAATALVYPVFGHWAWAGVAAGQPAGWLARLGFVDFAGACAVHSLGGWMALAGLLSVGNRTGRYAPSGKPVQLAGSSIPLAAFGLFVIWFGWLGWMGGSSMQALELAPRLLLNTLVASTAAGLAALAGAAYLRGVAEVEPLLRGVLAGLVAISGGGHAFGAGQALIVGVVAAGAMLAGDAILARRRLDDAVGAIPVHLAAGLWGTIAVALFGDPTRLGTGLALPAQLAAQLAGAAACALWGFGTVFALLKGLALVMPLRVTPDEEFVGLNVSEHQAATELMSAMDALEEMARHETPISFGEPFAEVAHIAYGADGTVVAASPPASAIFGYDAREFGRVAVTQLFAPIRDEPLDLDSLQASLDTTPREMRGLRRTGEDFPMEVSLGADAGTISVKDVTARKETEDWLTRVRDQIAGRLQRELGETPVEALQSRSGERALPGGELALLLPAGADWFGAFYDARGRGVTLYAGEVEAQASATAALLSSVLAAGGASPTYTHGLLLGDRRHPAERQLRNLAEVMNRIVVQEGKGELLLAMSFAHVDLGTGEATFVGAGRRAPALVKGGRTVREIGAGGRPLGQASDPELQVARATLGPGDCIVLCADGLVETYSPDGSVLRAAELRRLILARAGAREIRDDIAARARAVWKGHDQHAVLVLEWRPTRG
jgi:ammonium transporter